MYRVSFVIASFSILELLLLLLVVRLLSAKLGCVVNVCAYTDLSIALVEKLVT